MTTIYVAGPMSNMPDFNYPAFFKASEQLRGAGYAVENPAENKPEGTASWLAFMRMSLVQISRVDGLALLPGWKASKGATLEVHIAESLGLPVHSPLWWLRNAPEKVVCPECAQGKTVNCAGQALHPGSDELVACGSPR